MAKFVVKFKTNLLDLDGQLKRVASKLIPEETLKLQKTVALNILSDTVKGNPVGNPTKWKGGRASAPKGYVGGRSRANWQIGTSLNSTEINSTSNNAVATGSAEIAAVSTPYRVIWLFNNVPYIEALERGHSKQAPAGMLQLAIINAVAGLRTL